MSDLRPLVLILRFRDLVRAEAGHTVKEHNKITDAHGYTWWGWWKKQTEDVPVKIWSEIAILARASGKDGVPALLLDSGQRKLYSARIHEVSYRPDLALAAAPEAGRTPEYYNPPLNQLFGEVGAGIMPPSCR